MHPTLHTLLPLPAHPYRQLPYRQLPYRSPRPQPAPTPHLSPVNRPRPHRAAKPPTPTFRRAHADRLTRETRNAVTEMRLGAGVIYVGGPGGEFRNPARMGAATVLVCVTVEDVDGVCERARAAGAQISEDPADQEYGERRFAARDREGHVSCIAQPIGEVAPEDWGATAP